MSNGAEGDQQGSGAGASKSEANGAGDNKNSNGGSDKSENGAEQPGSAGGQSSGGSGNLKPNTLFSYPVKQNDLTLTQLMKEAKDLNTKKYPAAGSALLRSVVEVLLKLIIEDKSINPDGKLLDIEWAINLVISKANLSGNDTQVLKEFKKTFLSYINLSTHATVVPNHTRLMMARDCIDAFVKRNV
jgi:hypothetical protein